MRISRLAGLLVAAVVSMVSASAFAGESAPFTSDAFKAAQAAGKPILVEVKADWCPTCRAQAPIIESLKADPKFGNLIVFRVDFDRQKQVLRELNAQSQSTLIVFKGQAEVGRSVGDTRPTSIQSLVAKTL